MSATIITIFEKLLPIFFLILLGIFLRKVRLFDSHAIDIFKKIIINISLPANLFLSFLKIKLEVSYLLIFVLLFGICVFLFWIGKAYQKFFHEKAYVPFLFTGFEFGMMGAVFFGVLFGMDKLGYIAIIALGHEIFIWFVYVTLLKQRDAHSFQWKETLKGFMGSPIIIAIIFGILLNVLKAETFLHSFFITSSIIQSLDYLTGLTIPLILIIIGYYLQLGNIFSWKNLAIVFVRLLIILFLIFLIDHYIFQSLLHLEPIFSAALFIFLILPPPFILPIFFKTQVQDDLLRVNGILVLYTIFSIGAVFIYYSYQILQGV